MKSTLVVLFLAAAVARVRGFVGQAPATVSAGRGKTLFGREHVQQRATRAAAAEQGIAPRSCTSTGAATMVTRPSDGDGDGDSGALSREAWAGRILGAAAAGAVAVSQGAGFAFAEVGVGEGGLPNGARQFTNLVKVQKDWAALGASIKSQGAGVTGDEWKNVALFLRKVYQLGGDLEYLAGTFPSDKKKTALALVKSIQKEVQAADVPAREKNVEAFLTAQESVEKKFEEFMELFNDVPSEL